MRLIDADALMSQVKRSREKNPYTGAMLGALNAVYDFTHRDVLNLINSAPTIDAEPVVRCRDCKRFDMRSMECQNDRVSTDHEGGASYSLNFYLEDYCSFGERKMDEEVQHD